MSHFLIADRQTCYLLMQSVNDWLPEDHTARLVVDVMEGLDLSAIRVNTLVVVSTLNLEAVSRMKDLYTKKISKFASSVPPSWPHPL